MSFLFGTQPKQTGTAQTPDQRYMAGLAIPLAERLSGSAQAGQLPFQPYDYSTQLPRYKGYSPTGIPVNAQQPMQGYNVPGLSQQGYSPAQMPQAQGYTPQNYQAQGYAPQNYQSQGYQLPSPYSAPQAPFSSLSDFSKGYGNIINTMMEQYGDVAGNTERFSGAGTQALTNTMGNLAPQIMSQYTQSRLPYDQMAMTRGQDIYGAGINQAQFGALAANQGGMFNVENMMRAGQFGAEAANQGGMFNVGNMMTADQYLANMQNQFGLTGFDAQTAANRYGADAGNLAAMTQYQGQLGANQYLTNMQNTGNMAMWNRQTDANQLMAQNQTAADMYRAQMENQRIQQESASAMQNVAAKNQAQQYPYQALLGTLPSMVGSPMIQPGQPGLGQLAMNALPYVAAGKWL